MSAGRSRKLKFDCDSPDNGRINVDNIAPFVFTTVFQSQSGITSEQKSHNIHDRENPKTRISK